MNKELLSYINTGDVFEDACSIIDTAQKVAYRAVNITLIHRNWLLGKRIAEEELKNNIIPPEEIKFGYFDDIIYFISIFFIQLMKDSFKSFDSFFPE